ncbi:aldehyde dehydrogenase family protein [Ureaplasma miroungigenitalium]|uniref:Aldehyde dehydrogenase family protein n=1 Tax=Ureaplasma miroungigenitalium TaxID=1042321 RepID=A0ABT3BN64_9BACT|nr:aldehyde dehydrogenase family protein [Ureaplasma miroungigenitalium]MCV3728526.1 aldehyde dehydrogenase family protein [Ureaplasma miroungigenitalium]MCV3734509.1 aldehyde dehydrogenase family protein [Ureaplasma miroungigenitalium]
MLQPKLLINGQLITTNDFVPVINPTTNAIIAQVPQINEPDAINEVFYQAHQAFLTYSKTSLQYRIDLLQAFADEISKHQTELADLLVLEIAKSPKDSLQEVLRTVEYMHETIAVYQEMVNNPLTFSPKDLKTPNKNAVFHRVPYGVVLAISPFNYPLNLLMTKLAPALITGNTVVFKPATQGSLIGLKIAELAHKVNYPKGVINSLMTNARQNGILLASNPYVRVMNFTGSAKVGHLLAKHTQNVHLILELGGKDPAFVLDDADLDLASREIIKGAFSYSGQRCTAIKRVLVSQKNHDQLVIKMLEQLKQITVGLPHENPVVGPLISAGSLQYNLDLIDDAIEHQATILTPVKYEIANNLLHPVLIDHVNAMMRVAHEEPFGPILPILVYKDYDDAIEMINASEFGLQASIFTQDEVLAQTLAMRIEAGTININKASSRGPDILPFLGVKNSGFGVQGVKDALTSMTNLKGIVFNK